MMSYPPILKIAFLFGYFLVSGIVTFGGVLMVIATEKSMLLLARLTGASRWQRPAFSWGTTSRLDTRIGGVILAIGGLLLSSLPVYWMLHPQAEPKPSLSPLHQGTRKVSDVFTIIDNKERLYAADIDYVLQPTFDSDGAMSEIRVVPKYFFSDTHPDWIEPNNPVVMSAATYSDIVSKIETIEPFGKLIRQGTVGLMLNLRSAVWDRYEDAIVERDKYRSSPDEEYRVAWFKVTYFHLIAGKLEAKKTVNISAGETEYDIKIDDQWYLTRKDSFQQLAVGKKVKVRAAPAPPDQTFHP